MLRILVHTPTGHEQLDHPAGPLEIGRGPKRELPRLTVEDLYVSRDHLRIEEQPDNRVRLENISRKNPGEIEDAGALETGAVRVVDLPVRVKIGQTTIQIEPAGRAADDQLHTIRRPLAVESSTPALKLRDLGQSPSADVLTQWLERVVNVQRAAAGSPEFYEEAARAVVDLVGLDTSCVLLRHSNGWQVVARYPPQPAAPREFSHTVLAQVTRDRRTFYRTFPLPQGPQSLSQIEAVVASPILDQNNDVRAVLYGSRAQRLGGSDFGLITPVEAQVVQLLAAAVGAGLSRMERETQAARMRTQFEQFFSAELARELERDPSMLLGREREITVLFTDVRGFSSIAERLDPRETFRLMSDVMDRLTQRIADFQGVVVDYYGDGIAVMWNAPTDQPDHATLAARAALALRAELPRLNDTWSALVGTPLDLGVGMHTGTALVGNCGSSRRLKYGPRGHVVNLASRIEQATKHFACPILMSGETASRLGPDLTVRRLCRVKLVGVTEPVELFELRDPSVAPPVDEDRFRRAIGLYENGESRRAVEQLQALALEGDGAAAALCAEISKQTVTSPTAAGGVIELAAK
jgi:adenylate cyclase